MKKGRHRRFEEARELKRGPDIDIEAIFKNSNTAEDDDLDRTVSGRAGWFDEES